MVGKVGRCYQSLGDVPQLPMNQARYRLLKEFLEKEGCKTVSDGAPARLASARAGATTYGKNCFAFLGDMGSFIVITPFLVDAELDYDEPTMKVECPEECTLCIDACPTGALYEPLRMNPRRCIAFNSYTASVPFIPHEIREGMGRRGPRSSGAEPGQAYQTLLVLYGLLPGLLPSTHPWHSTGTPKPLPGFRGPGSMYWLPGLCGEMPGRGDSDAVNRGFQEA